ncbi:Pre-mRNA splicing factor-domain-containing protein [Kickxella alabastrina]|uniref:Pre-mRNA splicing factor-domain-containing protein n=1 Tax=Kickxella alabastrina TaxID=61397 RepID=UPI002220B335|nr:Pre-mRNA splicing factor-domain-containing protein [Kickxella alabastrina]KAI7825831.1 Pre-mRNA splicing factor-domain-containing protein [Kickxella alabastrina]
MGSGDLNMKKSWHPQTRANQLRVADEKRKAEDEARRTANILKELREERQREEMDMLNATVNKKAINKLEWMYNAPAHQQQQNQEDLEAYLLGKKDMSTMLKQKEEEKAVPEEKWKSGLFAFSNRNANSDKDSLAKSMEDPMMEIKRREQAAIQAMLGRQKQTVSRDSEKKKSKQSSDDKERKEHKKSKSARRSRSRERELNDLDSGRRHRGSRDSKHKSSRDSEHKSSRDFEHKSSRDFEHKSHRDSEHKSSLDHHKRSHRSDKSRSHRSRSPSHRSRRSRSPARD